MQLNRSDVLNGAIALLDRDGLDGLTMRKLAGELKVQPGALYWHVRHKQALLDAIAERLLDGVADIDESAPGVDRLAELAGRLRRALLSHRNGARVVAGTYVRQPNTLRFGDVAVRAAVAAGIPVEHAGLVHFALQDYVLGHTIEEQSRDELTAAGEWTERQSPIDPAEFPDISAAVEAVGRTDPEDLFRYGLDLFLDGVRARAAARHGG
ncbi:putative transcriptional regulator, TetR family protein [Longispora fulva]|uniref:TetR/AcrR family tetracycline transcriptional repressor n=1 Tax=Longispora fulva TaxID=619741 RepID=A0A8J7KV23_9ACTN|nr:TetR/AcrR family transcriptional regulator C-terminal domain-containing protein [Longispora fulva]MBG6134747.1 TetR/AcrR family tetracycline transcriptional repressor [Longispora fulva]GIG61958.1 putative transcriptional regulator, TetR family protein [Longispora fulva]